MNKLLLSVAAGAILLSSYSNCFAKGNKGVAAVIGNEKIMVSELEDIKNADARLKAAPLEAFYGSLLNMLVERKVLSKAAKKAGLEKDPRVLKELKTAKETIMVNHYLKDVAKKAYSKEKAHALYKEMVAKASLKKEIRAKHILVETKTQAEKYIKELEGGADFSKLAKEHSKCPSSKKGGDLGYFSEGTMVPEFSKAAFALKKGEYTKKPVKTGFGWHVIKLEDKRDIKPPKESDVADKIKAGLEKQAQEEHIKNQMSKIDIVKYELNGKKMK